MKITNKTGDDKQTKIICLEIELSYSDFDYIRSDIARVSWVPSEDILKAVVAAYEGVK